MGVQWGIKPLKTAGLPRGCIRRRAKAAVLMGGVSSGPVRVSPTRSKWVRVNQTSGIVFTECWFVAVSQEIADSKPLSANGIKVNQSGSNQSGWICRVKSGTRWASLNQIPFRISHRRRDAQAGRWRPP